MKHALVTCVLQQMALPGILRGLKEGRGEGWRIRLLYIQYKLETGANIRGCIIIYDGNNI